MTAGSNNDRQRRAAGLMLLCAALWSTGGIFIKVIPWNGMVIAGARSLISSLCVLFYLKKQRMRIRWNRASVLGGVCEAGLFLCFVTATKLTTAANAIVLQYTSPAFILLFSLLFLREKCCWQDGAAVLVTLGGIVLFFFDQLSAEGLLGSGIAVAAGVCMAAMFLITGRTDDESRISGILIGHWITALAGLPMALFYDTPVTLPALGCILVLGVVQLGIPYLLYAVAVRDCPPLMCSLISSIEPVLNPVWVYLFDGEAPGMFALIGGGIVIVTITVWCIWKDRRGAKQKAAA